MKNLFILLALFAFGTLSAENLQEDAYQKLYAVHAKYRLKHGEQLHELPEQLLTLTFLPPDAKVLEIGADVGRNSCLIASILNDSRNMVSVEPRLEAIPYLRDNRNINNLKFHIEPSAISKVSLYQKGWISVPSDIPLPGHTKLNTITFEQLKRKYGIEFDTLIVDCEGALYYILRDDPTVLNNIKLVIIENDFQCADHYFFVADLFRQHGLEAVHNEGPAYWGENTAFYQVWKKQ